MSPIDPAEGAGDLLDQARRLLGELDRDVPGIASVPGESRPALDVSETAAAIEIVVDVPGVPAGALRVGVHRNAVLVVGAKIPPNVGAGARFHVAERAYGRFARVVRVAGAFDASRARARLDAGLLRIELPRVEERRGRLIAIPVERA